MGAVQKLVIGQEDICPEERAQRVVGTVYDFISVHISMAELDKFPETYEALRDTLRSTGAHFGEAPPPEVYYSGDFEHEDFVPETYEEFKEVILSGFQRQVPYVTDDYAEQHQILSDAEDAFPETDYEFIVEARKRWLSWNAGAIFALEEMMPEESSGGLQDVLAQLLGENK